ncbi:MAG: D-alanyl-D-alanine carboxypeptidase [Nitrospira sp.]|nr:D-alanyl-D-alanine carboxypeptidase [Nitrospira sp.]
MKKLKVESSKFKVNKKGFLFLFVFSLFTFHFPLFTSSADEVRSRAAAVIEASTGRILYAKNPNLRLPPASTAKLMAAIVVLENANLDDVVEISKNAAHTCRLKAGLKAGDGVKVETLLYAALMESANDAAVALAEAVAGSEERFVHLMNLKAIAIGMKDTRFANPHGLPGNSQYTTAFDLSMIMRYALRYPKLREIIGSREAAAFTEKGDYFLLKNTNKLLWSDDEMVGGKTGYTRRARHCFVGAAERGGEAVIVTLLGSPTRDTLWEETHKLIDRGFRIMAYKEEPSIYFKKADYESLNIKKASYRKSEKLKVKSKKLNTEKINKSPKTAAKKKCNSKKAVKAKKACEKVAGKQGVGSKG